MGYQKTERGWRWVPTVTSEHGPGCWKGWLISPPHEVGTASTCVRVAKQDYAPCYHPWADWTKDGCQTCVQDAASNFFTALDTKDATTIHLLNAGPRGSLLLAKPEKLGEPRARKSETVSGTTTHSTHYSTGAYDPDYESGPWAGFGI